MKKIFFVLLTTLLHIPAAHSLENPWDTKLPFKEATVSYKVAGNMRGAEKVYVKDYGATTAAYTSEQSSTNGEAKKATELVLTTPEWMYIIDLSAQSGIKQVNPKRIIQNKFNSLSTANQKKLLENFEKHGITMIGEMVVNVEKNAGEFLGYNCDKLTAVGINAYALTGTDFLMKVSSNLMGISEEVVSIDESMVDEAKFTLPEGANIHHDERADQAISEQINVVFTTILAGQHSSSVHQQKGGAEMQETTKTMQQNQENDTGEGRPK